MTASKLSSPSLQLPASSIKDSTSFIHNYSISWASSIRISTYELILPPCYSKSSSNISSTSKGHYQIAQSMPNLTPVKMSTTMAVSICLLARVIFISTSCGSAKPILNMQTNTNLLWADLIGEGFKRSQPRIGIVRKTLDFGLFITSICSGTGIIIKAVLISSLPLKSNSCWFSTVTLPTSSTKWCSTIWPIRW